VRARSDQLATEALAHRQVTAAHSAMMEERSRLARTREEFRQCIWCLYELGRQTGDLDNELRRLARIQRQWSHAKVNTEITGEPFPLPASISRGLLLAYQEAVENASRHGKAERIEIHCDFADRGLEISVVDDGCGFDVATDAPGGHYGLSGMRPRVERRGGGWTFLASRPHLANPEFPKYSDQPFNHARQPPSRVISSAPAVARGSAMNPGTSSPLSSKTFPIPSGPGIFETKSPNAAGSSSQTSTSIAAPAASSRINAGRGGMPPAAGIAYIR
jgi:hypothetical protein